MSARPGEPIRVEVEVLSWVNRFVGGPGTGYVTLAEDVKPGATVRSVLRQVTDRYPELERALWDAGRPREIGDNIEVMVNHAVLGVSHDLDSELLDGDRVTLLGQYMGGSAVAGMKCPRCDVPMVSGRIVRIDVERCPTCTGVWLDHEELDELEDEALDVDDWKGTLVFGTEPTTLACPKCGVQMKRFHYRLFDLELECCATFHGYWLDAGEDRRILELMEKTKANAFRKLNAEARWAYFRRHIRSSGFVHALRKLFLDLDRERRG